MSILTHRFDNLYHRMFTDSFVRTDMCTINRNRRLTRIWFRCTISVVALQLTIAWKIDKFVHIDRLGNKWHAFRVCKYRVARMNLKVVPLCWHSEWMRPHDHANKEPNSQTNRNGKLVLITLWSDDTTGFVSSCVSVPLCVQMLPQSYPGYRQPWDLTYVPVQFSCTFPWARKMGRSVWMKLWLYLPDSYWSPTGVNNVGLEAAIGRIQIDRVVLVRFSSVSSPFWGLCDDDLVATT